MQATIFHNPECSTSRNALALLRHAGIEPAIVDYIRHPPTRERLAGLIARAGLGVREAMRSKDAEYTALRLDDPALSDAQLLDAMLRHPRLINRPFVETDLGVRLARPLEAILDILPPLQRPFHKENGDPLVGADAGAGAQR